MNQLLRVLIIDDSEDDALLLIRLLQNDGYEPISRRVDTESDMQTALSSETWDIIICDYRMPGFDGLAALDVYHDANIDIPFILVSGTIGEDIAVEAMHHGAHDYLMKHNLARLVPAIKRELQEAQIRFAHRRDQEALEANEKKYRLLVEHAPSGIYEYDFNDSKFTSVNDIMCEFTGYTRDELLSLNPVDLIADESKPYFIERQARTKIGVTDPDPSEYRIRTKHGEEFWVSLQAKIIYEAGKTKAIGVVHDITGRKIVEEELRKVSHAVEQSPTSVIITNQVGDIEYVNPKFTELTGYTLDEVFGKNPRILKSGLTPPEDYAELWATISSGKEWHGELQNKKKNGKLYWEMASISPVYDINGTITHYVAVKEDITEHKQAEEKIRESERKFRLLAENSTDMISLHTPDGTYLYVSPICKSLLDYLSDELVGHSAYEFILPDDIPDVLQSHTQIIDRPGNYTVQYRIRRKDGSYIWFETISRTVRHELTGEVIEIQAASRDITERKHAEDTLQRFNNRLLILREMDQRILTAHSAETISAEALERLTVLIPCEWASVVLYNKEMTEEKVIEYRQSANFNIRVSEGQPVVINEVLKQLMAGETAVTPDLRDQEGPKAKLAEDLLSQGARSAMAIPFIVHGQLIGVLALASKRIGFFTAEYQQIGEDLATQMAIALHQAELYDTIALHNAQLEQRVLERTKQLEAANRELRVLSQVKDDFVSNVSHELRTPITSLKLRQHLLSKRPERWQEHLSVISRETERLEHIIESLLYLSRLDQDRVTWKPTLVDLNALVSQFVDDRLALAESHQLALSFTCAPELPLVRADVALWEQALSVLLTNAFNYTPAGGKVEVSTQIGHMDEQEWVGVTVSDTGPGISLEEQSHLFERFFRGTAGRESGTPGTGLGLSIVREIVHKHGGQIEVFSKGISGHGTTFSLWLLAVKP